MAIAVDSRGTATTAYVSGTETFAHTVSGTDRFLVVQSVIIASASDRVTGITYNGVSMTDYGHLPMASSKTQSTTYYCLPSTSVSTQPSTGTNNVVISKTGSTLSDRTGSCAGSYTGVDTSDPTGDFQTHTTFGTGVTTITVAVNPDLSDSWIVGMASSGGGSLNVDGTSVTTTQYETTFSGNTAAMSDTNGTVTTGSKNVVYHIADNWKMIAGLVIQPAAAGATFTPKVIMF